jgi:hypothetical protein
MSEVQERLAANVVTSENLAEFTAQKLGLVDSNPATEAVSEDANSAAAEPDGENQSEQDEAEKDAAATDEQKEKKPNPKLERRFSEITKQREAARDEAKREREARESLEVRFKELEARVNPPAKADDEVGEEPRPDQFSDMYEYAKALAEYTADKKMAERDQQDKARKAAAEQEVKFKAWADRVNAAKNQLPDFDDMVQSSDVKVSDPVRDAIIESEYGPQILYYMAENAEFAKKLGDMSIVSAVREIGKIEARYERDAKVSAPEAKAVVGKSRAPAPISPLRGAVNTVDAGLDSDGNFHGTYQQWKAARNSKKIR